MQLPEVCSKVLYSEDQIRERVAQLGEQITSHYSKLMQPEDELVILCILSGSFIFAADLARAIHVPNRIDFMSLSSYGNATSFAGEVKVLMDCKQSVSGKHVLIVEDMIDSGATMKFLHQLLHLRKPASVATCVMVMRQNQNPSLAKVDYIGFELPNSAGWICGYGLDMGSKYRNLPYIAEIKEEIKNQYSKK